MEVLVLNASYEPLQKVTVRQATKMLWRQVAVVEEAVDGRSMGPFPFPRVLRLVKYIAEKWMYGTPRWTRGRLLARDKHTCAYCGAKAGTVDHVFPESRGGGKTWLNTVAACKPCNNVKANRTPDEAGMRLRFEPYEPTGWLVTTRPERH